ncbi:MAG: tetratricopeptide repeat protein [Syntrophales bacterium]|jgi:tetratricopeptide (TPR) repeat protein|nr:tetratricopeptide repeat protein [Syntrophales bacterium]MCK9391797.1 tetratricopeptide repeat protein [Syntrophales bacterium]
MNGPPDFRIQAHGYMDRGLYFLSLSMAKDRLIANPDDIPATVIACQSYLGMGNVEDARNFLARLDTVNSELSQLFKNFGDVYLQQGDEGQARIFYEKSAALSPFDDGSEDDGAGVGDEGSQERRPDLSADFQTLTMADLYIRQGHHEGAREILAAILARDPNHQEVRQRLDDVLAILNEKINDLPIDKKTTVVHELSRWLNNLSMDHHYGG